MTAPTQDQTAVLRDATVASLTTYGVSLGDVAVPIEAERIDPIGITDVPRIVVYTDDSAATDSRAGTAPAFAVTAQIIVQAVVAHAEKADALAALDALIAQIKDGLLSDPAWVKQFAVATSMRTQRAVRGEGNQSLADGRILIECEWREIYPPRVTQPLATITFATNPPAGTPDIASGVVLAT
jgi:hypothetical protein